MGSKKNGAADAGDNWVPLKSENDLEGVNFFFEIDPDPGVPYAFGRGVPYAFGRGVFLRRRLVFLVTPPQQSSQKKVHKSYARGISIFSDTYARQI